MASWATSWTTYVNYDVNNNDDHLFFSLFTKLEIFYFI